MFESGKLIRSLVPVMAFGMAAQVAGAATITVSSATVQDAADPARVCVGLVLDAEELVAGTGNRLVWDGTCTTLLDETCAANPAHGKDLSGAVQSQVEFTYKALVLSLTGTGPIPAGDLYCCDFSIRAAAPGDCCEVRIEEPEASDPIGNPLISATGAPGQVCLSSDAMTPLPTSTSIQTSTPSQTSNAETPTVVSTGSPGATGTSVPFRTTRTPITTENRTRRPTVARFESDDGCAIAAPTAPVCQALLPAAALLWLRRRRRRVPCGRKGTRAPLHEL